MKLSPQMIDCMEDVKAGLGTHGAVSGTKYRGRARTARALRKAGLLEYSNMELTTEGEIALAKALEGRTK